jgi:hypothetical protein
MTDEEKSAAAAYIKLHQNVEDLILTTLMNEMQLNARGPFANFMRAHILMSVEAEQKIKSVLITQMNKY